MDKLISVFSLFILLIICTLDGYCMMNYRLPDKKAYVCFAAISVLCFAVNSYITVRFGVDALKNAILLTIGLPYFILILLITKDSFSKTIFNFWLWINVYGIIASVTDFINDITFKNYGFLTALRFVFFALYFVLYNKLLKKKHKSIMQKLNVNWSIFSFIPMFFTILICLVNYFYGGYGEMSRNYFIMFTIHMLMFLVYILIFYTFKTAYGLMEKQMLAQNMKEQINLQKKQYEMYMQNAEKMRIFRHDARHRDSLLLNCLKCGDTKAAIELLQKETESINNTSSIKYCDNFLINAVLGEYKKKADFKKIAFKARVNIPQRILCGDAEFCVMLSNLLENSIAAAKKYVELDIKNLNSQLSLNVKNDYDGKLVKNDDGMYATTKGGGMGLGLKSVSSILKDNCGFLKIYDDNGVFNVYATLKN